MRWNRNSTAFCCLYIQFTKKLFKISFSPKKVEDFLFNSESLWLFKYARPTSLRSLFLQEASVEAVVFFRLFFWHNIVCAFC